MSVEVTVEATKTEKVILKTIAIISIIYTAFMGGMVFEKYVQKGYVIEQGLAEWRIDKKTGERDLIFVNTTNSISYFRGMKK